MHAVDAATGKAAWTFKTGGEVKSSPVVAGDRVLIGSYDTNLYALGAKDGKVLWKAQTEGYVHATPAVVDGVAYVTGCDEILRGDPRQRRQGGASTSRPAPTPARHRLILDGRAYYGTYENEVLAVDLKTHKIVWRYKHPDRNFPFYSSAALSGARDRSSAAATSWCTRIDRQTGKAAWTFTTRARVDSSPVVAGGRVYVGSNDGKLYVLDAATRQERVRVRGRRRRCPPRRRSPSGRLVIGSQDGKLFCLGARDARQARA